MVAAEEKISNSQSRRCVLRSGLRKFRASSYSQRASLLHSSNSQLLTSNFCRGTMLAGGKKQYYLDQEIALYLLGSGNNGRYYDATTGRFLSEDPTKEAGGDENLYRYTGNDPVNNLDPSGHESNRNYHQKQNDSSSNPNPNPTPTSPSNTKGANGHAENGGHQKQRNSPASHHVASAKPVSPAVTHPKIASEQQQQEILNYGHKGQQDQAKIASLRANWQREMQARLGQIHSNLSDAQLYSRMQHDIAQINALEHNFGQLQNEFNKAGLNQLTVPGETLPAGDVLTYVPGGTGFANAARMAGQISADWAAEKSGELGGVRPTYDEVALATGGPAGDLGDAVAGKVADAVVPAVKSELGKLIDAVGGKIGELLGKAGEAISRLAGKAAETSTNTVGALEDWTNGASAADRLAARDAAADAAENEGIVAKSGTKVTGFTSHGVDRAIGDAAKRAGTKPQAILDALKNPERIVKGADPQGRPVEIFYGKGARVIVNPQTGRVVSVNPLSRAGAH